MIVLDERSKKILLILLQNDDSITTGEIASRLEITPRMVRYNLRIVKSWLSERKITLESKNNVGINIKCSSDEKEKLISEVGNSNEEIILMPNERMHIIVLLLLTEQDPVLIKHLETCLSVSRPTILRDLKEAEIWLSRYKVSIVGRPHFGFQVLGRERDIQDAIVNLFLDSSRNKLMLALCIEPGASLPSKIPAESKQLREYISKLDIPFTKSLLDNIVRDLNLQLPDDIYISLLLHLSILLDRTRQGKTIEFPFTQLDDLNAERELQEARITSQRIKNYYNLEMPKQEITFFAAQLLAAQNTRTINENGSQSGTKIIDSRILEITECIVKEASTYLYPSLITDSKLKNGLAQHLQSAYLKLLLDLPIRNPLLEHIKRQYPYIFQVAQRSSEIVKQKMDLSFSDDEIGFIALHFGAAMERLYNRPENKKRIMVVCSEGVATAWLLVSRIRAELPDIEIVQVLSLMELRMRKVTKSTVDAIVATIPMQEEDIQIITVNPLLRPEDLTKLRKSLGIMNSVALQKPVNYVPGGSISLVDLLPVDMINLKKKASNWLEAVDRASEALIFNRAIDPAYREAMKQVIIKFGPYAVTWPGIVLLHARPEDGVKHLCMSLTTLDSPVYFGHPANDPVDIALVIGAIDSYSHLRALKELTELLADEKAISVIRSATDPKKVRDIIKRFTY